ncbi:MAG: cytochrome c maturation protein CcmE [Nannocystaceae bacterium]
MALPLATQLMIGAVIGAAALYLVAGGGETEGVLEYVYVEKVVAAPQTYLGRTIKVHGTVVPGTVKQKVGSSGDYTFEVEREGKRLAVHFTNMVPDTFAEGGEVVLTGQLSPSGDRFDSDDMAAKCPSKYEETPTAAR